MHSNPYINVAYFLDPFLCWGTFGFFPNSGYINKAVVNIVEDVSLLHVETSIGYMPRSAISGSFSKTLPNFLRNRQTDFQSGCTSLQSHQQWRSVPLSQHPCQHLLSPEFLILAIVTDVKWNLRVILICISLMIKDIEHKRRILKGVKFTRRIFRNLNEMYSFFFLCFIRTFIYSFFHIPEKSEGARIQ